MMDGNSTGKKKSESLKAIISNCEDFKEETTAMHDLAELLGVEMDKTPKGHPELAGRGVEYCWGKAKMTFRHINSYSPHKVVFKQCVLKALESVTLERAQLFLRKANDYKRAYRALAEVAGPTDVAAYADIERESKAHSNTLDQDYKFIAHTPPLA